MSDTFGAPSPLSVTDPRLSEWLDGRLPPAVAADVERQVAASPELARLVADLRRQRAALTGLPVSPVPVGFVQDVLAAVDTAGGLAADDAEVEEEWRRIERQRLDEEIAEAQEDAAEPPRQTMRQQWPWLALAAALAAGMLVAVVVNRPPAPGQRDVAIGPLEARGDAAVEKKQKSDDSPAALPAASKYFDTDKDAAPEPQVADAAPMRPMAAGKEFEQQQAKTAAPIKRQESAPAAGVVRLQVRSAAEGQRLAAMIAASGLATVESAERAAIAGSAGGGGAGGRQAGDRAAAGPREKAAVEGTEPVDFPVERLDVRGPPRAIAELVAALEAESPGNLDGLAADGNNALRRAERKLPAAGESAAGIQAEGGEETAPIRLVIEIVRAQPSAGTAADEETP